MGHVDDHLLCRGERLPRDLKCANCRYQGLSLGIHLEPNVLVEFAPDIQLQHIAWTDDVHIWVDFAILSDPQSLNTLVLRQAQPAVHAFWHEARCLGAGNASDLGFFTLAFIDELFQFLRTNGAGEGEQHPAAGGYGADPSSSHFSRSPY